MPVLLFANKQDLPNAMSIQEVTERMKMRSLPPQPWAAFGSCATAGDGLYEGLDWMSAQIGSASAS